MIKKIAFIIFFVLNLAVIVYFWIINNPSDFSFLAWGRLCGLLAVYFVLWQLLFISRFGLLERVFGLDRLFFIHHLNGFLSLIFILLHPLFLLISYSAFSGRGIVGQLLRFLTSEDLPAAFLATIIFILVVILSLAFAKGKVRYEKWYFVHLLVYAAVILAYAHQFEVGYNLQNRWFAAYFLGLYVIFILPLLIFRLLKPLWLFYSHRFRVERIVLENDQVVSVYISGRLLSAYKFKAGQFVVVRFLNRFAFQAHPFSFSKSYDGQNLRLTIKALGDFTFDLKDKIKVGDYLILEGPYGRFTLENARTNKIALVAGGVGVTPIRALLDEALKQRIDLVGISCFHNETEAVFRKEITELLVGSKHPWHYIFSATDGRLNVDKLKKLVPDYLERDFYLCGPPAMSQSVRADLVSLRVPRSRIHFERFSW